MSCIILLDLFQYKPSAKSWIKESLQLTGCCSTEPLASVFLQCFTGVVLQPVCITYWSAEQWVHWWFTHCEQSNFHAPYNSVHDFQTLYHTVQYDNVWHCLVERYKDGCIHAVPKGQSRDNRNCSTGMSSCSTSCEWGHICYEWPSIVGVSLCVCTCSIAVLSNYALHVRTPACPQPTGWRSDCLPTATNILENLVIKCDWLCFDKHSREIPLTNLASW